jgi:three-Cys-motif partner protein
MTPEVGRSWGYWTRAKLQILHDYLDAFATASRNQTERIYLDAFAGEADGLDRVSGEEFHGSARIALEAAAGAGFTRFRYFELAGKAVALEAKLRADYPGRDIMVYGGDCNTTIPRAVSDLREVRWAPTFAFVDPDGMEVAWATIAALADHKRGYRSPTSPKPEYKVELWILFPTSGIVRTLALDEAKLSDNDVARATRLFGTDRWRAIYELRREHKIDGAQAKEEYVNLMRWLLEKQLGYRYTHPFELKNTGGATLYHMIFATDNDAGTKIMTSIYNAAAKTVPQMQQEARDRAKGQQTLAFDVDVHAADLGYRYEAPWEPR